MTRRSLRLSWWMMHLQRTGAFLADMKNEKRLNRQVHLLDRSFGPGKARNIGVSHASSPVVIFLDDDNLPKPKMVEQFVRAIQLTKDD